MGADREVTIQHKAGKIVAHRVMWPEVDGEKYKLEHLYRGTVAGNAIKGELLVKEPELKDFEVLRDFTGSVSPSGELTLDGLPMKRLDAAPAAPAPAAAKPPAPTAVASAPPKPPPAEAPPPDLFSSIMGTPGGEDLLRVSNTVAIPNAAADLMAEGDELLAAGKPRPALAKYEEATKLAGASRSALLHRTGKCQLALKQYAAARDLLKRALRLDPGNRTLQDDYAKAKALAG